MEVLKRNKPNKTGRELVQSVCDRLEDKGELLTDHNILLTIKSLTNGQLNQLIQLGNIVEWHNELVNNKY